MKENLEISGKKLEIMSEIQLGGALDDFMLKEQRQAINDNVEETLIRQNKRLIKRKRGEDNDEQEGGLTFMITTTASVQEVYMVVSTSKARTKHTASYTIHRKRQTRTHDYDSNDDDGSGVDMRRR